MGHLQYQVTICSRNGGTNWFCILASHLNPSMIHSRYEHHQKIGVPHLLLSVIFHHFPLGEDLEYFKEDRFYPACVVRDEAAVGSSENNGGKPSDRQRLFMTWGFSPNSTIVYYSYIGVMCGRRTWLKVTVILYSMWPPPIWWVDCMKIMECHHWNFCFGGSESLWFVNPSHPHLMFDHVELR